MARTVLGLPLDLAAFVVLGYALFNSVRNLGYPLWYLDTDYHQAWGGPTMAGVWTVHALGWLLCLAVLLHWPVRWLARGQRALDRRLAAGRGGVTSASAPESSVSASAPESSVPASAPESSVSASAPEASASVSSRGAASGG